jgi:putative membrane protein
METASSAEADTAPQPSIAPATMPSPESQGGADRPAGNQLAAEATANPVPVARLSQSQIAMVTELANTAEIEQGKLAQTKAKAPAVKKFAAMMVKHHTEAKNEQAKLFKQLSLTPTQSQLSTQLKADADTMLSSLKAADGTSFDTTYVESQIEAHQKVLDALNQELLPAAADQPLVDGLNKMKSTVEAHLNEAKSILADLQKTGTGASGSTSNGSVTSGLSSKPSATTNGSR